VIAVHDLHVWPLSTTETALTAHLVAPEAESDQLLGMARDLLRRRFHIAHSTIQVERQAPGDCSDC
jgi:cobalt-zinc-cadmium efflux system protein